MRSCGLTHFTPEQLRFGLNFCAVGKNEGDFAGPVNDSFFNHHRPDGVVPDFLMYLRIQNSVWTFAGQNGLVDKEQLD